MGISEAVPVDVADALLSLDWVIGARFVRVAVVVVVEDVSASTTIVSLKFEEVKLEATGQIPSIRFSLTVRLSATDHKQTELHAMLGSTELPV